MLFGVMPCKSDLAKLRRQPKPNSSVSVPLSFAAKSWQFRPHTLNRLGGGGEFGVWGYRLQRFESRV